MTTINQGSQGLLTLNAVSAPLTNDATVTSPAPAGFDNCTARKALQVAPPAPTDNGVTADGRISAPWLKKEEDLRLAISTSPEAPRKRAIDLLYENLKKLNIPSAMPLRKRITADEFPLTALPVPLQAAIEEVEYATQAPLGLIAASALTAISVACHSLVSVERDEGLNGPVSLYFLTIATSGERKTSVDKFFTRAISEWEKEQTEKAKPLMAAFRAAEANWIAVGEGIKAAIKKAASQLSPDPLATEALIQHEASRPIEPHIPSVLRMDDTPEALAVALGRWPVAAIMSSEAGIIFGAHGMNPDSVMRNMGQLNIFWDGGHLKRDRTSTKSIDVDGMRVTVGLQVQPATLKAFLDKQGILARGTGFLARFLMSQPESTQGTRYYRDPKPGYPEIGKFSARCKHLLNIPANVDTNGKLTTTYLKLKPDAKQLWTAFHDQVEDVLGSGGYLHEIQDVASKAADNAARLAACLHIFCDPNAGPSIGAEPMRIASSVIWWYLDEALRFAREAAVPAVIRNAEKIENWLHDQAIQGKVFVTIGTLLQSGPVRNKIERDAALDLLEEHHRIYRLNSGKKREVCLTPDVIDEYRR